MKKQIKKFAVLLIGATLLVTSCKKEVKVKPGELVTEFTQSPEDAAIAKRIVDFKTKIDAYKNGTATRVAEEAPLSKEEAIFLMEATMNYTYARGEKVYEENYVDSETIVVEKNQITDEINFNEVAAKYWETKDKLKDYYLSLALQEKELQSVDFEEIKNYPNASPDEVYFKIIANFGSKELDESKINSTANFTSYIWGEHRGVCGSWGPGAPFNYQKPDAAKVMSQSLNWHVKQMLTPSTPNGYKWVWASQNSYYINPSSGGANFAYYLMHPYQQPDALLYFNYSGGTLVGAPATYDITCLNLQYYQQFYNGAITLGNDMVKMPHQAGTYPYIYTIDGFEQHNQHYNGIWFTSISYHRISLKYAYPILLPCSNCCYNCPIDAPIKHLDE